jgi:hypothetical protein
MNKELEIILSLLILIVVPLILGKITNFYLKIENSNFFDTWYNGMWLLFFIIVLWTILLLTYWYFYFKFI